jgi:hypothetical protein
MQNGGPMRWFRRLIGGLPAVVISACTANDSVGPDVASRVASQVTSEGGAANSAEDISESAEVYCINETSCFAVAYSFADFVDASGPKTLFSVFFQNLQGTFPSNGLTTPLYLEEISFRFHGDIGSTDWANAALPPRFSTLGNVEVGRNSQNNWYHEEPANPPPNSDTFFGWINDAEILGCDVDTRLPPLYFGWRTCLRDGLDGWVRVDFVLSRPAFGASTAPVRLDDFIFFFGVRQTGLPGHYCTIGNVRDPLLEARNGPSTCQVFSYDVIVRPTPPAPPPPVPFGSVEVCKTANVGGTFGFNTSTTAASGTRLDEGTPDISITIPSGGGTVCKIAYSGSTLANVGGADAVTIVETANAIPLTNVDIIQYLHPDPFYGAPGSAPRLDDSENEGTRTAVAKINSDMARRVTFTNTATAVTTGCTYTKGWYQNRNGAPTVIAVDGRSVAEAQAILAAKPGKLGGVTLSGANNLNLLLNVYQQLLTALNNLDGDATAGPADVDAAIALVLGGTGGTGLHIATTLTQQQLGSLATVLADFNEGKFAGWPHCEHGS